MGTAASAAGSNRELANLQIARLEAAAVHLEDELANLRARSQTTTDLNAVRQSLRPNLLFGKFEFSFPQPTSVDLEHEIRNIGSNAVAVSQPTIKLALHPITNTSVQKDLLVQGRDYSARSYQIGIFQPGESRRVDYSIDLVNENLRGVTIYYVIQWTTVTDPKSVSTAGQILAKQVSW